MSMQQNVSKIASEIILLRTFFNISHIYLIYDNNESDIKRIFIKPNDDRKELDDFFYQKANQYESKIKEFLNSNLDIVSQKEILNDELITINELINLRSAQEIIEYFEPILIDNNIRENTKVVFDIENTFNDSELKYIFNQFSIRKKYLRNLLKITKLALLELEERIKKPLKITGLKFSKLEKILSEFWYLSEIEIFNNQFSEKQLSLLRNQFFSLYGITDQKYSKCKSDMLERKEDNRFAELHKAIQFATKKIYNIDSRGVSTLKKKRDNTKK
jgi:hypothetical protein